MVIQVETYFVTSATLNGIWCIVTIEVIKKKTTVTVSMVSTAGTTTTIILYSMQFLFTQQFGGFCCFNKFTFL